VASAFDFSTAAASSLALFAAAASALVLSATAASYLAFSAPAAAESDLAFSILAVSSALALSNFILSSSTFSLS